MSQPLPGYCFDASGFLDGWNRFYPIRRFPTLWNYIAGLFQNERAFWSEEVWTEIRDDDLRTWLTPFRNGEIVTASLWSEAQRIQQHYNPTQHKSGIDGADPFVVAAAKINGLIVISGEVHSNGLPKIPNVCDAEGIECIKFTQLLDREDWTF